METKIKIKTEDDKNICEQCYIAPADDLHSCPYNDGMGGLSRECNCCASCVAQCEYEL